MIGLGFEVVFSRVKGRGTTGWQMILRKKKGARISKDQLALCERFRSDGELRQIKMERGVQQQARNMRGGK